MLPPQSHLAVPPRRPPYHRAVDRQGAVVQLPDAVADGDVYSVFAPADGGRGVSPHLTVQDGVAAQRFDTVRAEVPVNDGGLCRPRGILGYSRRVRVGNVESNGYISYLRR